MELQRRICPYIEKNNDAEASFYRYSGLANQHLNRLKCKNFTETDKFEMTELATRILLVQLIQETEIHTL